MTIREFASKNCVPCDGTRPLSLDEAASNLEALPDWRLTDGKIERDFKFRSYGAGLDFAYSMGKLAEEQNHHPEILIRWCRVKLVFTTHAIGGLSINDFVMAAKSELEYQALIKDAKTLS